ncbi:unnamed protein product, partial [Brassica rapa subsp. narinosa]
LNRKLASALTRSSCQAKDINTQVHNKMLTNHQVVIVKDDYFDRMMPSFFTCFLLISFIYLHYDMAIETIVYLGLKFEFHRSYSQRYLTYFVCSTRRRFTFTSPIRRSSIKGYGFAGSAHFRNGFTGSMF